MAETLGPRVRETRSQRSEDISLSTEDGIEHFWFTRGPRITLGYFYILTREREPKGTGFLGTPRPMSL